MTERKCVWISFHLAADVIADHLNIRTSAALKMLEEAVVAGTVGARNQSGADGPLLYSGDYNRTYYVDVWADDFDHWLASAAKPKRTPRSHPLVLRAIAELSLPDDTPTPALLQAIGKWHTDHGSKPPSRDTILRATGRRR
jgi:hypothetical protein